MKPATMKPTILFLLTNAFVLTTAVCAAEPAPVAKLYDGEIKAVESELVPLAEAMPADKYDFRPTEGAFKDVRTFGQQVKHIATVLYMVAAASQGQKPPVDLANGDNGPDSIKTKAEIVQYLKDAFAFGHKMTNMLTAQNQMELVKTPFGGPDQPRAGIAHVAVWHSFDHYGQMVVYARMCGVVPPASR
jgi:uncharacterized damage-inducible protein DinB